MKNVRLSFMIIIFSSFERITGTVEYQIMRSTLGPEDLKAGLRLVERRKNRQHVLPSDVPLEGAEEYWKSLNYNTARQLVPDGEDAKVFRPDQFVLANDAVERFREVSREGRKISEEMEKAACVHLPQELWAGLNRRSPNTM